MPAFNEQAFFRDVTGILSRRHNTSNVLPPNSDRTQLTMPGRFSDGVVVIVIGVDLLSSSATAMLSSFLLTISSGIDGATCVLDLSRSSFRYVLMSSAVGCGALMRPLLTSRFC